MDCVNYQLWFLEKLKNLLELRIQYNPLKLFVEKRQFFNQNIPWLKKIIYHEIANFIICFSVRFCYHSLFVIKMHFQVFSLAPKKVQAFSSDSKILMLLLLCSFVCKTVFQLFEILIFSQDFWGNVHYVPEINLIS